MTMCEIKYVEQINKSMCGGFSNLICLSCSYVLASVNMHHRKRKILFVSTFTAHLKIFVNTITIYVSCSLLYMHFKLILVVVYVYAYMYDEIPIITSLLSRRLYQNQRSMKTKFTIHKYFSLFHQ